MKRKNWINKNEEASWDDFQEATIDKMMMSIKSARLLADSDLKKGSITKTEADSIKRSCDEIEKIVENSEKDGKLDVEAIKKDALKAIFHLSVLRRYNVKEEKDKLDYI